MVSLRKTTCDYDLLFIPAVFYQIEYPLYGFFFCIFNKTAGIQNNHVRFTRVVYDDAALIDSLREKVLRADKRINDLELEREKLIEKVSKNHLADIMTALNMLKEGLTIKKKKMEKVENAVGMIEQTLSKIEVNP